MAYALIENGVPTPLAIVNGGFTSGEVIHPAQVLDLWSADMLAAINVLPIVETPIPEGKVSTGSSLALVGGQVIREHVLEDAPPPPPPTLADMPDISDRQFFQALALPPFSIITTAEALAAVKTGELPAALQAIVDAIPDPTARFNAEMLLSGATTFRATHPMVAGIAAAMTPAWTEEQVIAFWQFAASL
mgnify:CR=1 FL=1